MFAEIVRDGAFLAAGDEWAQARVVLVGAGLDSTVSFRPGTRDGPRAVRYFSQCLEEHSLALKRDLRALPFCDLGDIVLPHGDVAGALSLIENVTARLLARGKIPGLIGGEHLITLPAINAARHFYPELAVFHFDAHADLRDEYRGVRFSHATVMRRVAEILGPGRIYQFGIRSADGEEIFYAREMTRFYPFRVAESFKRAKEEIGARPVYVTLDIDVVDPAYAPGVGTPEPGGISAAELLDTVYRFAGLNVVGFDLVEVNPTYDPAGLAPLLAAKVIRELVMILAG